MAKIDDIIKSKPPGSAWHSVMAPEEFHVWVKDSPWKKGSFKKYGVRPASIWASASFRQDSFKETYSLKNRLILSGNIEIVRGSSGSYTQTSASVGVRVDSAVEVAEVLSAYCDRFETPTVKFPVWTINRLHIYRNNIEIQFARLDPDKSGTALYLERVIDGAREMFYPNIAYNSQMNYVGEFCDRFAHCENVDNPDLATVCSVKLAKERKLRKKKL